MASDTMESKTAASFDPFAGPQLAKAVPSTEPQREIWTAAQLGPEASLAFNESISLVMRGPLEIDALRASLGELARRHESLRATFTADGLTFCVQEEASVPLELVDLSGLAADAREREHQQLLAREVETPFDLEKGPLARVLVLRLERELHAVVVTGHHIVVDGWSWAVLVADWSALYSARVRGESAQLPPADLFSEYATDQAGRQTSAELAADEAYWLKQFGGPLPPALDLPGDRPRPARRSFRSRREDVAIDAALAQGLKRAGARDGASFFVTLLAAFAALLERVTGEDDVVIGIPAAGQAAAGLKGLVGHCVNTLPLRNRVQPEQSFRALLKDVRSTLFDAFEHQQHTFGSLVRKLPLPRDPGRLPLVSAVLNLDQTLPETALRFSGLEVHFASNPRHYETFDLFINAVESASGLVLECQYNADIFDGASVRRLVAAYEVLLRAVAAETDQPVARLPLLGADEKRRVLVEWNQTFVDHRPEATIHQLFGEQARLRPEADALLLREARMSYAELERRSNQLARRLRALGVVRGVPVGLCLERSFDTVTALIAILKAGGAYLPLEHNFPKERLAFMLEDTGTPLVLAHTSLAGHLPAFGGRLLLLEDEREAISRESDEALPDAGGSAQDVALIIYTSGSTGRPKGVEVVHRGVNRLVCAADWVELGPETTLMHAANLAFDASTLEIWGALLNGGRVALYPEATPTPQGLAEAVERHGVDTLFLTTALFNAILDDNPGALRGVRQLLTGGEAQSVAHFRRAQAALPEMRLVNCYGPTECTTIATAHTVTEPIPQAATSIPIGRPIRDTRAYVLDRSLEPVPPGVPGELYLGGPGLARGYLKRPELTAERFLADPFLPGERIYATGDVVRQLPDGSLDFIGRRDGQVKIRGHRIELGEIEAALVAHPSVAQAAVLARQDRPGDKALVAYVVPQAGATADPTALTEAVRRSLPRFMVPQTVMVLERFPLNSSGKLDRRALPAPAAPGESEQAYEAPRTPTEVMLAALWEKSLGLRRVGTGDDFFALGGHSLLAAQVLSRLNREHGIVLPFRTVFEAPTIARMAAVIDGMSREERERRVAPVERRKTQDPAPVSLMQERILLLEELDPERRLVHAIPSAFRLDGPLDAAALQHALQAVVDRHESLRTTFKRIDGAYRQIVAPSLAFELAQRDLRELAPAEREAALKAYLQEQTRNAFDVEKGPLFRAYLLRLADQEHVLFTLRHNTVWDGWSFDIFRHELATFYEAHASGTPAALPPLTVSYGDFAAWHREWLASDDAKKQLAFWRERLAGAPAAVELPGDRPRPAVRGFGGADEWTKIPRAESDALADLGRGLGATTFMVLISGFAALIHRWSGQRDFMIASPVRNRPRPEIEDIVGLFTNTLMLRASIDPEEPFGELVKRMRTTVLDAFSHQELPYDLLAREAPPLRVVFSLQEARHRETALGQAKLTLPHVLPPAAAVDVNLWLVEMKDGLTGALNYSTDIFDAPTMRTFLAQYRTLLAAVTRDPALRVGRIPLLGDDERKARSQAATPRTPEPAAPGLWPALAAQASRTPLGKALVDGDRTLGHAELLKQAGARAAWLRGQGVAPGDKVGLALEAREGRVAGLLGLLQLGAVPVPLDPREPEARLLARLAGAGAGWLWGGVTSDASGVRVLPPFTAPAGDAAAAVPEASGDRPAWVETLASESGRFQAQDVATAPAVERLNAAAERLGVGPGFVLAAVGELSPFVELLPLLAGAGLAEPHDEESVEDGAALEGWLQRVAANGLVAPAAAWRRLLATSWAPPEGFVAVASEPLPQAVAERLLERGARPFVARGGEETSGWWALDALGRDGATPLAPLRGVALEVLEPSLEPAPEGVPGMLCLRTAADAAFRPTGEKGRHRPSGIEALGRADTRARVRGRLVDLAELRARLREHPAVADAAAFVQDDPRGEPRLVALVVDAAQGTATDTELRRHLKRTLAPEAVPAQFTRVARLEWRSDGTLDTRGRVSAAGSQPARAPATPQEQLMVELWQATLGRPEVSLHDNYFDLGGHSLLCIELVGQIQQRTGVRLKPRVFLLGTLEQAAAELARAQQGAD